MAYVTGTAQLTNGSPTLTATGQRFLRDVAVGHAVFFDGEALPREVRSVEGDGALTMAVPWDGATDATEFVIVPTQGLNAALTRSVQELVRSFGNALSVFAGLKATYTSKDDMLAETQGYGFFRKGDVVWAALTPYQVLVSDAATFDEEMASGVRLSASFTGDPASAGQVALTSAQDARDAAQAAQAAAEAALADAQAAQAAAEAIRDSLLPGPGALLDFTVNGPAAFTPSDLF